MHRFIVLTLISTLWLWSSAQEIQVLDFSEFEPYIQQRDGKVHVVNFWATWCKPCVEELPAFEQLNEEYKDKNVEVLLVSLDMADMVGGRLVPFLQRNNIESEVVLLDDPAASKWIDKVSPTWSGAIPATLIYSDDKRLFYERSFTYGALKHVVESKFLRK